MVALYGAGADVDAEDLSGLTALHCAVRDARLETVRRGGLDAGNGGGMGGILKWGTPSHHPF